MHTSAWRRTAGVCRGVALALALTGSAIAAEEPGFRLPNAVNCGRGESMGPWTVWSDTSTCHDMVRRGSELWCATAGGLLKLDLVAGTCTRWTVFSGLPSSRVLCLAATEEALWAGTQRGVVRVGWETTGYLSTECRYDIGLVKDMVATPDGRIWCAQWADGVTVISADGRRRVTEVQTDTLDLTPAGAIIATSASQRGCRLIDPATCRITQAPSELVSVSADQADRAREWFLCQGRAMALEDSALVCIIQPAVVGPDGQAMVFDRTQRNLLSAEGGAWTSRPLVGGGRFRARHPGGVRLLLPDGTMVSACPMGDGIWQYRETGVHCLHGPVGAGPSGSVSELSELPGKAVVAMIRPHAGAFSLNGREAAQFSYDLRQLARITFPFISFGPARRFDWAEDVCVSSAIDIEGPSIPRSGSATLVYRDAGNAEWYAGGAHLAVLRKGAVTLIRARKEWGIYEHESLSRLESPGGRDKSALSWGIWGAAALGDKLLLASDMGLGLFDTKTQTVTRMISRGGRVTSLTVGPDAVWFGEGVLSFTLARWVPGSGTVDHLRDMGNIGALAWCRGRLFTATRTGMFELDPIGRTRIPWFSAKAGPILTDSRQNLWIGCDSGIVRYDFHDKSPLSLRLTQTIDDAISRLGHADFAVRETAERELRALGPLSAEALRTALDHPEPEIRLRAATLLHDCRNSGLSLFETMRQAVRPGPVTVELPVGPHSWP